ncbi:periplasmic chaperone for outer membrane proteins Skp [Saccharicrinis carchari]|uniref:Periplasmic chaperone for outer membrane proteins Skp n=1 Tax=Saccharicrinis carchari TaxID=1168039 RepID=A0A521CMQ4_SACCC|nr:OmpH family outer membrane protein [Saccharicrinis carchari]SMO60655.1 periplasmic chaperone for outer membrane proteins Skp [Saccharicrinis carchari]
MRPTKLLFVGLALMASTWMSAQSNLKFGHVNTQAILAAMPELKTIDEQLQSEYETLEGQLTDMQEDLQGQQKEYLTKLQAGTMSAMEREGLETQLQEGQAKVQNFFDQSQQSLQQKEQTLKRPLFDKVSNAIKEVGAEKGFLYIFEEASGLTVYKSEKSVDVSDLVKAKLGIE